MSSPCPAQGLLTPGRGAWGSPWISCCHKELLAGLLRDKILLTFLPYLNSTSHPRRDWASFHFTEKKIEAWVPQMICLGVTEPMRVRAKIRTQICPTQALDPSPCPCLKLPKYEAHGSGSPRPMTLRGHEMCIQGTR